MKYRTTDKLKRMSEQIKSFFKDRNAIKQSDLTMGMVRVIILCWIIPYLTFSVVLFYSIEKRTTEQIYSTIETSMKNAAHIADINIDAAITESKLISYDGVVKDSYMTYLKTGDETKMYKEIIPYLNNRYKYSTIIKSAILMFNEKTSKEFYTYSNAAGATYANINFFKQNAALIVKEAADDLGTGVQLVYTLGHLYIVRNIVNSDYEPFAIIVMEINVQDIFQSFNNIVWQQDCLIYLDKILIKDVENFEKVRGEALKDYSEEHVLNNKRFNKKDLLYTYDEDKAVTYLSLKIENQRLSYIVKLDKVGILSENNTIMYTFLIMAILLIPFLIATFYYFYSNISKPILELVNASEKIEERQFGYRLEEFGKNREFGKLINTFNHMSVSLEESFNRIYAEEVALRDANMQALQAQINPHFLNNTLEIINWKARMSGDKEVSRMVESLSVMMEATMNRKNEPFITIKEEMKYVDAYLYIIVQRFGEKFQFEKKIDDQLMDLKIPRLIIQPLVENMVEHGGDEFGRRKGRLLIYSDQEYLYIVVENNGNITKEDQIKIQKLLENEKLEEKIYNIGIRNVNLRLKLLYSDKSGLSIRNEKENLTISEIKIELNKLISE